MRENIILHSDRGHQRPLVVPGGHEVRVRNLEPNRRRVQVRQQPHAARHVQKVVLAVDPEAGFQSRPYGRTLTPRNNVDPPRMKLIPRDGVGPPGMKLTPRG
jgi:hypothetical protein